MDGITAISGTDVTAVLVMPMIHDNDGRTVPIGNSAMRPSSLIPGVVGALCPG